MPPPSSPSSPSPSWRSPSSARSATDTTTVTATVGHPQPKARAPLRAVALPTEHGGWGITAEPVLLGLLVAPSIAGGARGAAALLAFLARTPIKTVLVDWWRHRHLPRTRLAARVAAIEVMLLAALVVVAGLRADHRWWWAPIVAASPLVLIQLWFDMRSRSRRLLPELCGAVGIASVAAGIAHAGGTSWTVAAGLWAVLAARAIASIPFARTQVQRIRGHQPRPLGSDVAQLTATLIAMASWASGLLPWPAAAAITAVALSQLAWVRSRPTRARRLGFAQLAIGLGVTLTTAVAIR